MKKKYVVSGIVALVLIITLVWWNGETVFLRSLSPEDISVITVRDGHTGNIFEISGEEDISYIVKNIQNQSFRKGGISLFRLGTWFTLSFCDKNGNAVNEFILNGAQTVRKDPFFHRTETGNMQQVLDYIDAIEERTE